MLDSESLVDVFGFTRVLEMRDSRAAKVQYLKPLLQAYRRKTRQLHNDLSKLLGKDDDCSVLLCDAITCELCILKILIDNLQGQKDRYEESMRFYQRSFDEWLSIQERKVAAESISET